MGGGKATQADRQKDRHGGGGGSGWGGGGVRGGRELRLIR